LSPDILIIVLGTCFRSASNSVRHEVSLIALWLCRIVFENNFLHRSIFPIGDSPRGLFEMCEDYTWLRIARDLSSSAICVWILEKVINIRKKILFVPNARESAINSNRLKTWRDKLLKGGQASVDCCILRNYEAFIDYNVRDSVIFHPVDVEHARDRRERLAGGKAFLAFRQL